MLIHLMFWFYISFCSIGFSILFGKTKELSFEDHLIQGLVYLGTFLMAVNLIVPLSWYVHILVLLICLFAFISKKKWIEFKLDDSTSSHLNVLLVFVGFLLLAVSSGEITLYDANLYHIQSVIWKKSFSAVPGLGNLHGRLAFNSSALTLNAFFSEFESHTFPLNSFLIFIFVKKLFVPVFQNNSTSVRALVFPIIMFPLICLSFILMGFNNPSPDTFLAIMTCYLFLYLKDSGFEAVEENKFWFPIVLLFFLPTIKLGASFLPLLVFYFLFRNPKLSFKILLIGLVLLMPFLITNYIYSGYLIYPSGALDFFYPNWKIPKASLINMMEVIEAYAKDPHSPVEEVLKLNIIDWISVWFKNINRSHQVLFCAMIISIFVFLKNLRKTNGFFFASISVLVVVVTLCLIKAPDFRFMMGAVASMMALILWSAISDSVKFSLNFKFRKNFTYICVLALTLRASPWIFTDFKKKLIFPIPTTRFDLKEVKVDHQTIWVSKESGRCGDAQVPCTPEVLEGLQMRGPSIGNGFRIKLRRN
jgi:hypothetical protein